MSKSLKRVITALRGAGLEIEPVETGDETRTAAQAAAAVGCLLDQIAKSIIFRGADSGAVHLFVTAGGNRVDPGLAQQVAGEALDAADAAFVRARTGFVIGGVSPVGHLTPGPVYFDPRLTEFAEIWAAAGTPRHVFRIAPTRLIEISGAQVSDFTTKLK
ncbi:YbaK/EbsC family protein [Ponticoccus sp. SC2-23]|uniref:YbaK/EbsC family protein n=1 Tax=Alexandriicola marinus TaxID=2081710 RepID=UPI000FD8F82D|nr:YbaK/EbsC family protein [Alexandriicola marinus]MBM1219148.1 YbaK/EbsC family protein [Ponticoccus sp. SC6-9]MBM1223780.1 YbaK/EbsC family protein [Ponticoccus sp. SC6-15]MBM1228962.1 YbaK/EbsC family protein [Ponticoccus sp. SC6-38]MBM1232746.1 YbaK/EbsC family protein [Ponticoccus sp. SC6-45]MBM1237304.1 YbaK/EbsC family protein [Ponticoccus sp. SC6-49]MBM1241757.1 YbaK/EbsC family protein [Ponticoccus sp. SC2-64]MBM1246270.1 YbaK/EbsC family protein [Ponticoccus sp. SC6-42]MBM1250748